MSSASWTPDAATGTIAPHFPPLTTKRPSVVLFVEDEGFLREMASGIMESAGYNVLKARDAAEAMQLFRRYCRIIDLLLTDVVLPGKSGRELAGGMRAIEPKLKVLFISGYVQNAVTQQPREPGTHYLPKPFSAESLLEKINQVMGLQ